MQLLVSGTEALPLLPPPDCTGRVSLYGQAEVARSSRLLLDALSERRK